MSKGKLFIISAASGTGKTSLVRRLLAEDTSLQLSTSTTTRPARPGEIDGIDYHFIDEETFLMLEKKGEFLETARVFENLYGTSRTAVLSTINTGKNVLLEIDWQGAEKVRQAIKDSSSIFILPPSIKALDERLHHRAQDSEATIRKRLQGAKTEISHSHEFNFIVINDDFDTALEELKSIINGNFIQTESYADKVQRLTRSLLED